MSIDFDARQAAIKTVLTCPICKKLCRKVTIIEECCHRFCRKCITGKIREENLRSCPVCNLDLGCAPLQKLSLDNRWQSFRTKFSEKRNELIECGLIRGKAKKLEVGVEDEVREVLPSFPCVARRKERSSSSIVRESDMSNQTSMPGRRRQGAGKHPPQHSSFPSMRLTGKEGGHAEGSKAPINLSEDRQSKEQSFVTERVNQEMRYKGKEPRGRSSSEQMHHLSKPLNDVVEDIVVAKSNNKMPVATPVPSGSHGNEADQPPSGKLKGLAHNLKSRYDGKSHARSDSIRLGKMHQHHQQRTLVPDGSSITAQSVVDARSSQCLETTNPVWFSLIATDKQEGCAPLPQIRPCYLRVKDSNVPVSFIQKYLVKMLGLDSENEVEVILQGQPLFLGWRLHEVMELWLRMMPKPRQTTFVGSSAEEFVMVLSYARRAQPL